MNVTFKTSAKAGLFLCDECGDCGGYTLGMPVEHDEWALLKVEPFSSRRGELEAALASYGEIAAQHRKNNIRVPENAPDYTEIYRRGRMGGMSVGVSVGRYA